MNQVEQLTAAKALIDTPGKFHRGGFAVDAKGRSVTVKSPEAVCFCSLGAIERVLDGRCFLEPVLETIVEAFGDSQYQNLPSTMHERAGLVFSAVHIFNDSHTHEEVMAAFDRAIEIAKERNL